MTGDRAVSLAAAVLASLFFTTLSAAPILFASDGIELLLTGEFHGDEVSTATGERWMGLFRTDTGFELAGTTVTVEYIEDAVLDNKGKKTGKKVGVARKDNPVLLLRGIAGIEEGPVTRAFDGWDWLNPGVTREMGLAGKTYRLYAFGQGEDKWNIRDYGLILNSGGASQELVGYETCCDDSMPALIWAGDLDGDGALDLYLELSNHYNVARRTLFLSSLAGEGELVGKAAEFVTYGC